MAFDQKLATRVRDYLLQRPQFMVTEKKMFGGLAFLVQGKMCVNVSGDRLMCRFDPDQNEVLSQRPGFSPMVMRGKALKGYCYAGPEGIELDRDFDFWMQTCLSYNPDANLSK